MSIENLSESPQNQASDSLFPKSKPPLIEKCRFWWCFLCLLGKNILPCFIRIFHESEEIDLVHKRKTHHGDHLGECAIPFDAS